MTEATQLPLDLVDRYIVTIQVPLEYEVRGSTIELAAQAARDILRQVQQQFPAAKMMRLMSDLTYVALEAVAEEIRDPPSPPRSPRGSPTPGGTPGTPTIAEPVITQVVAKAA